MPESEYHEELVRRNATILRRKGHRVVILGRKSPDMIAVKDGKIIAVEVLGYTRIPKKGKKKNWTVKEKKLNYKMFDDLIIIRFEYPKTSLYYR